jgi:hypothetical protein
VTLEEVREHDAFELISIAMPSLVCVDEDEHDAWLAHGDAGGDMVALREARTGKLGLNTFWGEVNGILPVIMAGHSGAVCVQETTAFMDGTLLSVMLAAGLKGRGLSPISPGRRRIRIDALVGDQVAVSTFVDVDVATAPEPEDEAKTKLRKLWGDG